MFKLCEIIFKKKKICKICYKSQKQGSKNRHSAYSLISDIYFFIVT